MISAKRLRKNTGSSIADFAPALFVLLVVIMFPLMDLLAVAVVYNCGSVLNGSQTREAALEPFAEARDNPNGFVQKGIVDQWAQGGLGRFCKLQAPPQTTVTYKDGLAGDKIVVVTTNITASPFLNIGIPFLPAVPGLNAPVTFTYSSEHIVENPENAPP